ncbi:DMT family transporter [Marisediminicola antarctica]|uniref:Ligand-binding protein SH3 n=1 Tax=Marisediminicola antarctica TaxID=674079 RepID=A0A7L5AJH7_9MICO|nr:SMR family transporter [Marisediminicola antarctica]QHO69271.1 ligand-binding protein SH3 [Marisediminicola antarctica]
MAWVVLFISAALEAVWATALGASDGLSEIVPTIVFGVALTSSMATLAYAATQIPISTAYAVWAGTGAALTVSYGMLTGQEVVTVLRVLFLIGIVGSVIGLKLLKSAPPGSLQGRAGLGARSAEQR